MVSRIEIMEFLSYLLTKAKTETVNCDMLELQDVSSSIDDCIRTAKNAKEAYMGIGLLLTGDMVQMFNGIIYREDCYEHLLKNGFEDTQAYELMECIRRGKFRHKQFQIHTDKMDRDFYNWAIEVRYLPSRNRIIEMFGAEYEAYTCNQ